MGGDRQSSRHGHSSPPLGRASLWVDPAVRVGLFWRGILAFSRERINMTKDKDRTPVAQSVITMCTKCEMELNHVVVAHDKGGVVERVKCQTCGSEHKYRPDKKRAPKKSAKKSISTQEDGSHKNL